jgi:hypothetical protein
MTATSQAQHLHVPSHMTHEQMQSARDQLKRQGPFIVATLISINMHKRQIGMS